jgi:hypothetical protein
LIGMMLMMIGGLILVAAIAVAGAVSLWRSDGYGSAPTRGAYDSRRPHPTDAESARVTGW